MSDELVKRLRAKSNHPESDNAEAADEIERLTARLADAERMAEALAAIAETYANMEDGDGEPCPDVASANAALAAWREGK